MTFMKKVLVLATLTICTTWCAEWMSRFPVIFVGYQETAVMACSVDVASFKGFYDNNGTKIIEKEGRYKIEETDASTRTLEIFKAVESDFGKYYCADSASNKSIELEISVTILPLNTLFQLAIGDEGVIEAGVYAMPKYPISWIFTKDGTTTAVEIAKLDDKGNMIKGSSLYDISTRGSLTIKKVTLEHAGEYRISVSAGSQRKNRDTKVEVGDKPILIEKPESMYTVTQYLDLKIPCVWSGKSSEYWTYQPKNGTENLFTGDADQTGISLKNVTAKDEGIYYCKSTNDFGMSIIKTELKQVIVPAVIGVDRDIKIPSGKPYSLVCESMGTPSPNIIISKKMRDGSFSPIKQGIGKVEYKSSNVDVSFKGSYQCQAENGAKNKAGESLKVSQIINVDVLTPPTIILADTTPKVTSAVGLDFTVTCVAQGNPEPNVTLSMNGVTYVSKYGDGENGVVTAQYTIKNAEPKHFGTVKCSVVNTQGADTKDIQIIRVVKASPPGGLRLARDVPGLEYIDLKWNASKGADGYIVYINDTRQEKSPTTQFTITGLKRSTYYSFRVAAFNLAGDGNRSKEIILKTSDIKRPGPVSDFKVEDVTSISATISWKGPSNIPDSGMLTYKVRYCTVTNNTRPVCRERKERKDRKAELTNLQRGTTYNIKVIAVNQGVNGEEASKTLTTKNTKPTTSSTSGKTGGLSTGAIAGVIIAVILIILIVIDLFCCFFNNCGFSHCCFETFCSSKGKKYAPADTNDQEEMKPKQEETV